MLSILKVYCTSPVKLRSLPVPYVLEKMILLQLWYHIHWLTPENGVHQFPPLKDTANTIERHFIPSHISGQGYKIGPVCVCVCLSVPPFFFVSVMSVSRPFGQDYQHVGHDAVGVSMLRCFHPSGSWNNQNGFR